MPVYNTYPAVDEKYQFNPIVRQAMAGSPEVNAVITTKIKTEVPDAVSDAIAEDSTIVQAAKDAVDGVLGDRLTSLEETVKFGAAHLLETSDPDYAVVNMSYDFRILGGTLRSGGVVGLTPDGLESVIDSGSGTVKFSYDYRLLEPGGDSGGMTPQVILDSWSDRMSVGGVMTALLNIGDSMTADYLGLGVSVGDELASELGVKSEMQAYSGQTQLQILWRVGGVRVGISVAGGTIPASGEVSATVTPKLGWFRAATFQCYVVDATGQKRLVSLKQSGENNPEIEPTWTVSQIAGTSPIRILEGSRITPTMAMDSKQMMNPAAVWIGRNDPDLNRVSEYLQAFIESHRDPLRRLLVRPIFNRSSDPAGSANYERDMAINEKIKEIAGSNFFDDRSMLIQHGLEIAKINPTPEDRLAISEDRIPLSLMVDQTHLNEAGRKALARIDAIEIKSRNWFS